MTSQEKLQQLFQAALAAPEETVKPTRVFSAAEQVPIVPAPAPTAFFQAVPAKPAAPAVPAEEAPRPMANAGLSAAESDELGQLLDGQRARLRRKRRRDALVVLGIFFSLSGGGFGWFISSPTRVQAAREAMRDIRSYGDVAGMVAQYKLALDKISVRSKQIDEATKAMGVSADPSKDKDIYMDAEMKEFMGGEGKGKTIGERNRLMQKNFGDAKSNPVLQKSMEEVKKTADAPKPADKPKDGQSFDWKP